MRILQVIFVIQTMFAPLDGNELLLALALMIVLIAFGVGGNILTIVAVVRHYKDYATFIFYKHVIVLAVADIGYMLSEYLCSRLQSTILSLQRFYTWWRLCSTSATCF